MNTDTLIKQIKNIPEIETEALWYLNTFGDRNSHPWKDIIDRLYIDFNICLPPLQDNTTKRLIIGLTVLVREYELVQGNVPGKYHLYVDGFGHLDEIEDVSDYLLYSFARIVTIYYQANEKDELDNLEKLLLSEIRKWNWHAWVKQEEVIALLANQLKDAAKKVSIPERKLPEVLHDYYSRIDRIRLENLDSFLDKSDKLLNSSPKTKVQAQFFSGIIDEVKNGGENLRTSMDILPHYTGIKLN